MGSNIVKKTKSASDKMDAVASIPARSVDDLIADFQRFATDGSEDTWKLEEIIAYVEDEYSQRQKTDFYTGVGLDPKGSTVRKLKASGKKHPRFEPHRDKMPIAWTTRNALATMSDDDFDKVVKSGILHRFVSLPEIQRVVVKSSTKRKAAFRVSVNIYELPDVSRQREFARRFKKLTDEFKMKISSPEEGNALARLIAEVEQPDQKQAA